jgi:hypothetical protein
MTPTRSYFAGVRGAAKPGIHCTLRAVAELAGTASATHDTTATPSSLILVTVTPIQGRSGTTPYLR